MPKVSYIVSAYDRPAALCCCLASLALQTDFDFEVIVADNAPTFQQQVFNDTVVMHLADSRFRHLDTTVAKTCAGWDCYHSAEIANGWAHGEWLCFPSDDSYYMPTFQEKLLSAASAHGWGLVYCDMIYDGRGAGNCGQYHYVDVSPRVSRIDKTGFLVRRELFTGFPGKPSAAPGPSAADGLLVEDLVRRGVPHGKVGEPLMVHN
jgi:hypothetical protein